MLNHPPPSPIDSSLAALLFKVVLILELHRIAISAFHLREPHQKEVKSPNCPLSDLSTEEWDILLGACVSVIRCEMNAFIQCLPQKKTKEETNS